MMNSSSDSSNQYCGRTKDSSTICDPSLTCVAWHDVIWESTLMIPCGTKLYSTLSPTLMLHVVKSSKVTIPSLQAGIHTIGVTGTLFSITGVCWNFQCENAPQYPLNWDTEAQQLTPEVFYSFLPRVQGIGSLQQICSFLIGIFTACLWYLKNLDLSWYSTIKHPGFVLTRSLLLIH